MNKIGNYNSVCLSSDHNWKHRPGACFSEAGSTVAWIVPYVYVAVLKEIC